MRRRLHQRTGSLLALFAMLLITFAPAVSQWLTHAHAQADAFTAELCSAHASASAASSAHHASSDLSHLDGQACGYCHFFAHAPALSSASAASGLVLPVQRAVIVTAASPQRPSAPYTHAQSRAPPVLI